jgi:hypothetical protein
VPLSQSPARFTSVAAAVIVALVAALSPGWVQPAQAATTASGHLAGTVRDDAAAVISNARVRLLIPGNGTEVAATTTGSSGRYGLDVAPGIYDLLVTAGSGSDLDTAVVRDMAVSDGDTTFDVVVVPPQDEPTFRGRIVDASGAPFPYPVHMYLQATYGSAGEANTAPDGTFSLHAPHGHYGLGLTVITGRSIPEDPEVSLFLGMPLDLTRNRTETLTIPIVDLDVHLTTDSGAPGGYVSSGCDQCDLPAEVIPGTTAQVTFRSSTSADPSGTTRVKALASTNTWIRIDGSETLYPVARTNVTVPAAGPITINQPEIDPATKATFQGHLIDQHGHPLDGYVTLQDGIFQDEIEVADDGGFALSVPPGHYQLKLRINVGTVWVQLGEESGDYTEGLFVTLDDLDLTAGRTQNLTVPIVDFPVLVLDAAGQPTGASVSGTSGDTPGQYGVGNAAVELFPGGVGHGMLDNEDIKTDASGIAHLQSFPGAAPPVVTASQGVASGQVKPAATATAATVKLSSSVANVNGTIVDRSGPLTDQVRVDIEGAGYDLTTGPWGLSAPAGHVPFRVGYPYDDYDDSIKHVPGPTRPAYWWVDGTIAVAGDATVNLTLPDADHADVYLYGEGGRPAWQGATTAADTVGASIVLAPGITATGHAQSDATTEIGHIRAPMFGPSTVSLFANDWIYTTPLAKFALKPNETIHVLAAVHSSQPAPDPGPAVPPTPTTDPPATPTTTPQGTDPAPGATTASTSGRSGYWALGSDGHVYNFGDAPALGNASAGAVDLEPTATGKGYWTLNRNGTVQTFGDALRLGDVDRAKLAEGEQPASLSATPSRKGYWVFTNRGRVLAFGDAPFLGDMSQTKLNGPVLGSVATPTGKGYYMVASDGGIFAFGDATFAGSMGDEKLNAPVQSLVPDSDGHGYWLVASDGGIFAFDAPFRGSMGGTRLNKPVVGMVRYGDGYLMVGADGGIFNFSTSPFAGSLGDKPPATPVVAVAALP